MPMGREMGSASRQWLPQQAMGSSGCHLPGFNKAFDSLSSTLGAELET